MAQSTSIHLRMVIPPAPWTRAMEDGSVRIPGLTWECVSEIDNAPDRFIATEQGDVAVGENGVRRLVLELLKGRPARAIPVWFGREHMQRNIIVRADSPLHHPRDLAGKRIGSRLTIQSGTGAAVLMVLDHAYGIDLMSIDWFMGDPASLPANAMGLRLHDGPTSEEAEFAMLLRGDVDAVIETTGPRYHSLFGADSIDQLLARYPGTRPLIEDPGVIAETYRRTGLYPISDLATVDPDVARAHPEIPGQVVEAFSQANRRAAAYRPADEQALAEREIELLGEDPHVYGLSDTARANIAAFIDFLHRLGAFERPVPPEDLFHPSTLPGGGR
ncbi:MAG TPA: ABC transporter substrate-binding protein [Chloroflexota bacterium]|nr:ABC transporter substrate-binding protein [Chloroflexota bacterium]